MPFFKLGNINKLFGNKIFTYKSCITNKALFTIKHIQMINLNKYVIRKLDVDSKIFVMHVAIQEQKKP